MTTFTHRVTRYIDLSEPVIYDPDGGGALIHRALGDCEYYYEQNGLYEPGSRQPVGLVNREEMYAYVIEPDHLELIGVNREPIRLKNPQDWYRSFSFRLMGNYYNHGLYGGWEVNRDLGVYSFTETQTIPQVGSVYTMTTKGSRFQHFDEEPSLNLRGLPLIGYFMWMETVEAGDTLWDGVYVPHYCMVRGVLVDVTYNPSSTTSYQRNSNLVDLGYVRITEVVEVPALPSDRYMNWWHYLPQSPHQWGNLWLYPEHLLPFWEGGGHESISMRLRTRLRDNTLSYYTLIAQGSNVCPDVFDTAYASSEVSNLETLNQIKLIEYQRVINPDGTTSMSLAPLIHEFKGFYTQGQYPPEFNEYSAIWFGGASVR